jgi:uncharacterized protein (UPF0261 family)
MNPDPGIALIGTLDTKGAEIDYVRSRIEALGSHAIVIDSGILGQAQTRSDVTREHVARAGGHDLQDIQSAGSRGAAIEMMRAGVRAVCQQLLTAGKLQGVLCLGGAEGALLGAYAMQALPFGIPKLIVTPIAAGRLQFGPLTGSKDIMVMHSVVDILGLNPIARSVFDNAAAAIVGMAAQATPVRYEQDQRVVGITMLGQTTPGVMRLRELVTAAGWDTVIFHANGVGGPAMEELARSGVIAGVIDYTLSELANTMMDGLLAASADRLTVVGELGLPQVVVPGCVDFFNQGAPNTVPESYRRRRSYYHNPYATLIRLEPSEMEALGNLVAAKLNLARGPVAVVAPRRGFSLADTEGNALWYPEADLAFLTALESSLRPEIPFELVDLAVNEPQFAERVARRYLAMVGDMTPTSASANERSR